MAAAISSGFAVYFVIWWITLFLTLPFGVRSQHEDGEERALGTDPGAPVKALMLRRMVWTTIISLAIYAAAATAYYSGLLNITRLSQLMGFPG
jgi:predicted secreted protein